MRAAVSSQRYRSDIVVVEQVGDEAQSGANQDADVLANNEVVDAGQLGRTRPYFNALDGLRYLLELYTDRDKV